MKKLLQIILSLALFCFLTAGTALAANVTLRYATNTAPSGLKGTAEKIFLDEIEAVSNGEIKIQPFWQESLLKGKEILTGINKGTTDLGQVNVNYYPKRLLMNSIFSILPVGPRDYDNKMAFYNEVYSKVPSLAREFSEHKQRAVYTFGVSPFGFCLTSPAPNMAAIKGKKVRASSRWLLAQLKDFGATPVSLPFSSCYMSLQTGGIDGVYTNLDAIHRVKLDEAAPNLIVMEDMWVGTPYIISISEKKWKKLTEKQQGYIIQAATNAEKKYKTFYNKFFDEMIKSQKEAGYKIHFAGKEEIDTWLAMDSIEGNIETWVKEAKENGAENPAKDVAQIQKILQYYIDLEK